MVNGYSGFSFTGLSRQKTDASPVMVSGDGGWWGIGIFNPNSLANGNTLPGPKENYTKRVELWAERVQESLTMTVDEHGNMEHYKEVKMEVSVCHSNTSSDASESVFTAEVSD